MSTEIVFSPDKVFDIYVELSEDLHIDTNTYNTFIQEATLIFKFKANFLLLFLEYSLKRGPKSLRNVEF